MADLNLTSGGGGEGAAAHPTAAELLELLAEKEATEDLCRILAHVDVCAECATLLEKLAAGPIWQDFVAWSSARCAEGASAETASQPLDSQVAEEQPPHPAGQQPRGTQSGGTQSGATQSPGPRSGVFRRPNL